jgi:hypothetical protein
MEALLLGMSGATTTRRPFLISGESGRAHGIPEFSNRPSRVFSRTIPPPPDSPWFVRLAEWPSAHQTQPRPGDSQSADGGTIFFEGVDEFAADDPRLVLEPIDLEPESGPRVVLWMRDGDSTLRSVTIGEASAKSKRRIAEIIEFPSDEGPEDSQVLETAVAYPLKVWTLWTTSQQ